LFLLAFPGLIIAQNASNIRVDYSCPEGTVTVIYDLNTSRPTDATLYYSHNKHDWLVAQTVTGDLTAQSSGTDKTIVWDNAADNVSFGRFYFKIEVSQLPPVCRVKSTLTDPPYNGWITFLCYNLGVSDTVISMTPAQQAAHVIREDNYGDLYQWGRRADGHQLRTSDTTPILATSNTPNHPYFILDKTYSNAPVRDWRSGGGNIARWGDGTRNTTVPKGVNDPCPSGWRVPTEAEWRSIVNGNTSSMTSIPTAGRLSSSGNYWRWNRNGTPGWLIYPDDNANGEPALFLPAAGCRYRGDGLFGGIGTEGRYWSSTSAGTNSYYMYSYTSTVAPSYNLDKSYGFSVRCVSE